MGPISTLTYALYRSTPDVNVFAGPGNTLSSKQTIELKRIFPKPVAGNPGRGRPGIRITETVATGADTTDELTLTVGGQVPVGCSLAVVQAILAKAVDLLQLQAAEDLFANLDIDGA